MGLAKRGEETLTNHTLPKGVWTLRHLDSGAYPTPSCVAALFFPSKKPKTDQTKSHSGGVQKFSGGCIIWYVFLSSYFLRQPISRPRTLHANLMCTNRRASPMQFEGFEDPEANLTSKLHKNTSEQK